MKLYYLPGTCSLTTHVALEAIGEPFEAEAVPRDQLKSAEFLSLNPMGTVPVLQDGDFTVSQTLGVLNYLQLKYPTCSIFGKEDIHHRGRVGQWLAFFNTDLHKTFTTLYHPDYFVDTEAGTEDIKNHARHRIVRLLDIPNKVLDHSDYIVDDFSVADVYLYVFERWCERRQIDIKCYPNLLKHARRVESQEAFKKVAEREGLGVLKDWE